jgi:hypothetical protein
MHTDNPDFTCHQNKEHATIRPSTRLTASLSPARLLMRMENIHRLGKKDVPRQ